MKHTTLKEKILIIGLIVFVLFVGVVSIARAGKTALAKENEPTNIVDHVSIGGIDVSGMTKEEAEDAISALVTEKNGQEITLTAGDKEMTITPEEVGFTIANDDVVDSALLYGNTGNLLQRYRDHKDIEAGKEKNFELAYTVDQEKVKALLDENADTLGTKAVNHGLKRENGEFIFVEGTDGLALKVEESADSIKEYFEKDFMNGGETKVALSTEVTEPVGSAEELKSIKDVLGSYNTTVGSFSTGRGQNVINGASKINGTVVYPGETISVGETMGPSTVENGYTEAGAYENGKVVQSLGGGICQVSTTLYNAVIRAELEVVERYAHSMIVGYVKPSEDAAIADGVKDFKFKNTLDTPVYLEMYGAGGVIYANVYGKETRPANRKVTFESETVETYQPQTVLRADSSMSLGSVARVGDSAHTGYSARLWKIVTVDGVEKSREVFNTSKYRATNVTYAVGTASDSPEASAAVAAAVASNDLNGAKAAAAEWNAKIAEQKAQEEAAAAEAAAAEAAAQTSQQASGQPAQTTTAPATTDTTQQTQTDNSGAATQQTTVEQTTTTGEAAAPTE